MAPWPHWFCHLWVYATEDNTHTWCYKLCISCINHTLNSLHYRFGTDSVSIVIDDVQCITSSYLTILQCPYSIFIDSNCVNGVSDASVTCCESELSFFFNVC